MGGLKEKMPTTFRVFVIGGLALAGVPIFAGFFSKDEILWEVFGSGNIIPWLLLAVAALFTAFYTTRAIILTFYGQPRDKHLHDHAHESPPVMTVPLMILAVLSTVVGPPTYYGLRAAGVASDEAATLGADLTIPWLEQRLAERDSA